MNYRLVEYLERELQFLSTVMLRPKAMLPFCIFIFLTAKDQDSFILIYEHDELCTSVDKEMVET